MERDTSTLTLMIVPDQRYYPPLFDLFREQFDYFIMDSIPFNLLLQNIESGGTSGYKVLRVEGDFAIIFSKKVLDN